MISYMSNDTHSHFYLFENRNAVRWFAFFSGDAEAYKAGGKVLLEIVHVV